MPTTLAAVLDKTKNGQAILDAAIKLGFQNVRLHHSFSENTVCLVVDFDIKKEQSYDVDRNASFLGFTIARSFNCKVIVLQGDFMSPEERKNVAIGSILLPIQTGSQLRSIFPDPTHYKINTIKEDRRYEHDLATFEAVHLKEFSESIDGSRNNNSSSANANAASSMTPLASTTPSASDASYQSAKSSASEHTSSNKTGPAGNSNH